MSCLSFQQSPHRRQFVVPFLVERKPFASMSFESDGVIITFLFLGRLTKFGSQKALSIWSLNTSSTSLRPYRTHHVQLGLYCLGLGAMGFDISLCRYTILTFKRACVDCHQLLLRACPILGNDISNFQCNLGRAKSFCFPFNLDRAVCDLNWALEFWTGVRQSTATTNPRKCIVCRHSEYCHSSLA